MPRYFFNVHDGSDITDTEGHECADLASAQRLAVRLTGDLIRSSGPKIWEQGSWELEVTDSRRLTMFRVIVVIAQAPVMALDP